MNQNYNHNQYSKVYNHNFGRNQIQNSGRNQNQNYGSISRHQYDEEYDYRQSISRSPTYDQHNNYRNRNQNESYHQQQYNERNDHYSPNNRNRQQNNYSDQRDSKYVKSYVDKHDQSKKESGQVINYFPTLSAPDTLFGKPTEHAQSSEYSCTEAMEGTSGSFDATNTASLFSYNRLYPESTQNVAPHQPQSVFGGSVSAASHLPGNPDLVVYSDHLDESAQRMYEQSKFSFRQIPLQPPVKSMCY